MSHEVRAHSRLGASSMYRWRACPGSVRLCETAPDRTTSYAAEGSVAHELAEAKLAGTEQFKVGQIVEYEGHQIEVTQEMHDCTDEYVALILAHAAQPGCELLVEKRLDLSSIHPAMFGTSDAIVIDAANKTVTVYDYKHGAGIAVDAEDNEQMQFYLVGALLNTNAKAQKIAVVIVQPRAFHVSGPVRRWEMSPAQVFEFIDTLTDAAKATEAPDAPLAPGDHCRFCNAAPICPKLKEVSLEAAQQDFPVVKLVDSVAAPVYDPEELNRILRRLPAVKAWVENVERFAREEALAGRGSPGHKLVRGRGSRELRDVAAFRRWLELGQGIAFSAMHTSPEPELLSVAQIEKKLPKDAVKEFKDQHVRTIPGGLQLVEIEDKRPAAQAEAAVEFQAVTLPPE